MKRCINCLAECDDSSKVCTECGYNGSAEKSVEHALPPGTRLNNRYLLGGAVSRVNSFICYYGLDTHGRCRVKIYEYLPAKLMYRHPEELVIKYFDEKCSARGDKEISAFYAHFTKLCTAAKNTVLDFTDCFADNSTVYYVCSTEKGTPLSSLLGNGKTMSFKKATEVILPLAECVAELEKTGKWHGCISPYSIITNGEKITSVSGYSYPPKSVSSPFDAPEKQLGSKSCGIFTDIYSLGAILYEAVTGFLPPAADRRQNGRLLKLPANLSDIEKAIIEKALALDKEERYASAEEFIADLKGKPKKEKLPKKEIMRRTTLTLASVTLVLSLAFLINYFVIEPLREKKQTSDLASMVQTTLPEKDPWDEIRAKYPDINFPAGMNPSYADLYASNTDFSGWINIGEMNIDFPVVQASDNQYYERRDFYGKSTNYGAPFFDYRNSLASLDRNTIIYGHNMRHDDKLFGTLEQYRETEGFAKAPVITMNTLFREYKFKIYAVFISNSKASDDNGHVFNYIFTDAGNAKFRDYIAEIDKRKLYTTGVDINENDKILTLSTCCYDFEDARLVVVGRLLRNGESEAVDTSLAVMNENPKFPQAYYNAKRIDNPYKDDPDLFN
ncbi:MAG: class B sortase [Acutalibacteraceae bacterium]|nr:class B sortase [Acutalibacteraceae bacterium]